MQETMVGSGEASQACSNGFSESLKEDKISQLPDHLICQILSHLSTKESVKTSVLSTRWKSLWLWVPRLELSSRKFSDFSTFVSFGNMFFDSNRVSSINNVKLTLANKNNIGVSDYITSWIAATIRRKVQHLHVRFPYEMPLSLYTCETLVSLKLHMVALPNAEYVSLPCLKTMHLQDAIWSLNEATFERLVSSCPVLEELEIQGLVQTRTQVLRVLSRSLERLTISIRFFLDNHSKSVLVIDAPRLSLFTIEDNLPESFIITNMDSNVKLDIYISYSNPLESMVLNDNSNRLRSFLPKISKVKDMIIHISTFQLLYEYSKLEHLPQFGYVSRLQVALCYSHLEWLPTFLGSFPNLKSLILGCYGDASEEMNENSFSYVPDCLLSSLEFVDFKVRISGLAVEMKLVQYFLENSTLLKKLTLPLHFDAIQIQDDVVKKLLEIPRRSTECEVVFL